MRKTFNLEGKSAFWAIAVYPRGGPVPGARRGFPSTSPVPRVPRGSLRYVSLFDREDVAPPEECSRCGLPVAQTSLFCPSCGQSRVNPLQRGGPGDDTSSDAERASADGQEGTQEDGGANGGTAGGTDGGTGAPRAGREAETQSPEGSTGGDTLTRATQWLRRTLGRGLNAPDPEPIDPDDSPLLSEAKAKSYPERLSQSSRARARFVLTSTSGATYTLGETPGGIGSGESAPEGDRLHWIQIIAEDQSVDPVHLRFGVSDGVLWVEDANSVFGTVVIEPGRAALQCIPYERYPLVRGSEIRLGSVGLVLG